tara:strand:- start:175 stop:360 length:186 start_codon:yes stop_codon:yes gene_type:complete
MMGGARSKLPARPGNHEIQNCVFTGYFRMKRDELIHVIKEHNKLNFFNESISESTIDPMIT